MDAGKVAEFDHPFKLMAKNTQTDENVTSDGIFAIMVYINIYLTNNNIFYYLQFNKNRYETQEKKIKSKYLKLQKMHIFRKKINEIISILFKLNLYYNPIQDCNLYVTHTHNFFILFVTTFF